MTIKKAVILAGGLGTRIAEETSVRPKPMIEIAGRPILWHIMKIYSHYGINEFVICAGYLGYMIKEYFSNYSLHMSDVTFDIADGQTIVHRGYAEPWKVTVIDTGPETMTGGRLRRVREHIGDDHFCMTYGDGLADIDIGALVAFHVNHNRDATVTRVLPPGRFGALDLDGDKVVGFQEKPMGDGGWINGGFFVLSPKVLDRIDGDEIVWEREPLEGLARDGQLFAYRHSGFWQPMDTLRDKRHLEELWEKGGAPWKVWWNPSPAFWAGKVVLLTGHTGFKGAWLQLWLESMGAQVHGLSLAPENTLNLALECGLTEGPKSTIGDIRDSALLADLFARVRPDVVLHLAAQALVRRSYVDPIDSFSTNVIGTLRVLEAASRCDSVRAAVIITTDKCYENREWIWPYRETEALGGRDPYSASKACAEIATAAWRSSLSDMPAYRREGRQLAIATARAGNVFGGGDWALDRLVPDFYRARARGEQLVIRNPQARRPWQHVLEPVCGYLLLAEHLWRGESQTAYNFGPDQNDVQTVAYIVDRLFGSDQGGRGWVLAEEAQPHEATFLALDAAKARAELGWRPRLPLSEGLDWTHKWYTAHSAGEDPRALTLGQIERYVTLAAAPGA